MPDHLQELIDLQAVESLMESLWSLTGVPARLLDPQAEVLAAVGQQDLCRRFHHSVPELAQRCLERDAALGQMPGSATGGQEEGAIICPNGLREVALPVRIQGRHLGTLIIGLYFGAAPELEIFRQRARRHGLDEAEYLKAVRKVPVVAQARIAGILGFSRNLIALLTAMGLQNLQLRRQQQSLQLSEERFRLLFESAPTGMSLVDPDGLLVQINQAACTALGYSRDDLLKTDHLNLVHPADREREARQMERLKRGEIAAFQMENRYIHADGEFRWGWLSVAPLRDGAGRPVGFIKQRIDTTQRRAQEEALQRSEQRYRRLYEQFRVLFEGIPDPLLLLAPDLRIDWANPQAVVAFNASESELVGSYCYEVVFNRLAACEACFVREVFASGRVREQQVTTLAGDTWNVRGLPISDEQGRVHQVLLYWQEVGGRLLAQAEAIRASQLASLGELAAGVAHEINNPLNGIINYAQMLHNRLGEESRHRDITDRLLRESNRIAAIVGSLLAFARPQQEARRPVSIAAVLQDCLTLTGVQLQKQGVILQLELPADLPLIPAIPQHLQQVFLNLISNARHALQEKFPGPDAGKILQISGETVELQAERWVRLSFQDFGTGIPEAIMGKVLNPFFTTKPPDRGTGLGLSISHGIIKDHGGRLQLSSVPGVFTSVTIDLPVSEAACRLKS